MGAGKRRGAALLLLAATSVHAARPEWEALRGLPVVEVRLDAREVFDPECPEEDHRLFLWINALHVRTRARVVRRELLLGIGSTFDPQLAEESERNLRSLGIFQDAELVPERVPDGVRVVVRTSDRWSTELRLDVRRQGGIDQVGFGVFDSNLLGRAVQLGGLVTASSDLDAVTVAGRDPRLLGSRWDLAGELRDDELLRDRRAAIAHPFYSESVRWTAGLTLASAHGTRRRFASGEVVERLAVREERGEGFAALHGVHPRLERWALFAARRRLRGDVHDDVAAVGVAWSRLGRRFGRQRDVDLFGVDEDVAEGWTVQVGGGADLRAAGAAADRGLVRADGAWARFVARDALVGVQLRQHGFLRRGRLETGRLAGEAYGFWRTPGIQTLAWRLGAAGLVGEPRFLRYNLGGDDRLRGYEARHLVGERILYASLEERLFTDWRLYILRLGAVVFVDAAAAWDAGERPSRRDARLGVGCGLRLGSNRVGSSTTGIDVAFGSGSVQVSFASGSFFRVARGLEYLSLRLFE